MELLAYAILCLVRVRARAFVLAGALSLAAVALSLGDPLAIPLPVVRAQADPAGRVLGPARGQVAWLDLLAPRTTPLTQLVRPAYPADVAGAPDVPFAVASVVAGASTSSDVSGLGADLVQIDLASTTSYPLLLRQSESESLELPAVWPDARGIVYQRSNLRSVIAVRGQARPQYQSRVEQVGADGSNMTPLLDDAHYPAPAPDGARFAFVRANERGAGLFIHSIADGSDVELIPSGRFLALAYPRFSPDGRQVAFVSVGLVAPVVGGLNLLSWFAPRSALAHGFPWEAWMVDADGTDLRQIQDVYDDDPSVAWSPDGSQLLIYGGWGSFVIDVATGSATSIPHLAGYGSIAWLPN
jgi:hypothetical protein